MSVVIWKSFIRRSSERKIRVMGETHLADLGTEGSKQRHPQREAHVPAQVEQSQAEGHHTVHRHKDVAQMPVGGLGHRVSV